MYALAGMRDVGLVAMVTSLQRLLPRLHFRIRMVGMTAVKCVITVRILAIGRTSVLFRGARVDISLSYLHQLLLCPVPVSRGCSWGVWSWTVFESIYY